MVTVRPLVRVSRSVGPERTVQQVRRGVHQKPKATAHQGKSMTFGSGYVELALELGVKPDRIDTIADFPAIARYGVKGEGNAVGASAAVLAELAELIVAGQLDLPIARTYPLDRVRDAYTELEQRHTRGKIVLVP
jgi:NADPH:quinone reductase-like Zn-dependent oxidoreductase